MTEAYPEPAAIQKAYETLLLPLNQSKLKLHQTMLYRSKIRFLSSNDARNLKTPTECFIEEYSCLHSLESR